VSKFDYDVTKAPPAFKEATRETPEYLGQSIVIVPLSIGVGFAVLLGGLLICWGLQKSGRGALVAGGVAMAACALFAFWRVFKDELYMAIETITGHDWNRDGWIGQPPEERLITIEITNPNNNNLQYLDAHDCPLAAGGQAVFRRGHDGHRQAVVALRVPQSARCAV